MKNLLPRILLFCVLLGLPAAYAAEEANPDPYAQAVATYVAAANDQLSAIRVEADAATKNATVRVKQQYADVYQKLTQCQELVARLKIVGPTDFDPAKARFEQARTEMVAALEAARRGD